MYALNAKTGAKLWSYDLIDGTVFSSPVVANGIVYICSIRLLCLCLRLEVNEGRGMQAQLPIALT